MEQSSTSTIKLPNKELVGIKKEKDLSKEDSNKLPQPTGWRMLVLPFKMKEKTKGGVILAETTLERQQVASQCGLVLKMGPDCYKDKERYADGPWCKEGEWVMFCPLCWIKNKDRRWRNTSAKRRRSFSNHQES
jgi:co-chaperonin GroES (HSP10)